MLIIWLTQNDKSLLNKGLKTLLKKYKIPHQLKITHDLVTSDKHLVLALGEYCKSLLAGHKIVAKNRTINSLRNKIHSGAGTIYLLSYDPDVEMFNYSQFVDLKWDLKLARRYVQTKSLAPKVGHYVEVKDFKDVVKKAIAQSNKTGRKTKAAVDLETMGLDPYAPGKHIISVHVSIKEGEGYCIYVHPAQGVLNETQRESLIELLTSDKIITEGANFKYDMLWMRVKWGLKCTNFTLDTHLAGSLIDENVSSSLNQHSKTWTSMGGYDTDFNDNYDKNYMEDVPKEDIIQYGGGDSDACYRVGEQIRKYFKKHTRLRDFYIKLLHPAGLAFHEIEALGCWVDVNYYSELRLELQQAIKKARKAALKMVPKKLINHYTDPKKQFNLTKPSFLKDFLFGYDEEGCKKGLGLKPKLYTAKAKADTWEYASTAANHLALLRTSKKAIPFLDAIESYSSMTKTLSTYVDGFLKHLRSDGRFHPSFFLYKGSYTGGDEVGTVTGRCVIGSTLIMTNKGLIPIREIVDRGLMGESFEVLTHKNRWKPVLNFINNGIKPVCKIETKNNYVVSTFNHPYMSFPTWKIASDLTVSDIVYEIIKKPEKEIWKKIVDWPFEVSNLGRIRRSCNGRNIKKGAIKYQHLKGQWGHVKVRLSKFITNKKISKDFPVHRLVAMYFVDGYEKGLEVSHLNGIANCNWSSNLKWVTRKTNSKQMRLHGSSNKNKQSKLTWSDVDFILNNYEYFSDKELSVKLDVSRELIRDVRLGKKRNGRRDSMVGFSPVLIQNINTNYGVDLTFDLTVEEDHSYIANGLVVHNTSVKGPALQTLTKRGTWAKPLRRAFIAPKGYVIVACDYSEGELRVGADRSGDEEMLDAYAKGISLHAKTAANINDISIEDFNNLKKEDKAKYTLLRFGAKAGNFGLIFGMQAQGFQNYARDVFGVHWTLQEATDIRNKHFALYKGLLPWHEREIRNAHKCGYVENPLGRVRHLPLLKSDNWMIRSKEERRAINSPVQSCLNDLLFLTLVVFYEKHQKWVDKKDILPFLTIHDQVLFYVREKLAKDWAYDITQLMSHLPLKDRFGWEPKVTFLADAEIGYNLAEMEEITF